jgi:hypothetical protein
MNLAAASHPQKSEDFVLGIEHKIIRHILKLVGLDLIVIGQSSRDQSEVDLLALDSVRSALLTDKF